MWAPQLGLAMLTPAVGGAQDSHIQILTPQGSRHQQPLLPLRPTKQIIIISIVCLGMRKGLILESVSLKLTFEACQVMHASLGRLLTALPLVYA